MAALTFAGVRKDYGEVRALRGLDLEVRDGEFIVLVGPSGCGKTTILRLAAGLEAATGGTISIGSRDVTKVPPAERKVSMVFQTYALFPHLTVSENIGFGLAARRVPREERRREVLRAAETVGCADLLARRPHQLSGGERQRVALARALVRHPDVFLLDEPLSNLDAQLRVEMRAELRRLHQRVGATMVYVTHDQVEALTMGDRVAVLREGLVQQVGPPDEIYRRPTNRFVAGFIGSPAMNFLPASFDADAGRLHAGPFAIVAPDLAPRLAGRRLEVGIRPEHVVVRHDESGARAEVQIAESTGSETFLHLVAAGHRLIARVEPDLRPAPGTVLHVDARAGGVYVFDEESGAALAGGP